MGLEESPRDREGGEWPESSPRRERPRRRRTTRRPKRQRPQLSRRRREMLTLIGINAALSLVISLAVIIVWEAVIHPPTATPVPAVVVTATSTPMAALSTAAFTPEPGQPVSYRIQPGDTLSSIALDFNVDVEDIIAANDLENPDFIPIGLELIIPIGGLPGPTPTATPVVSPSAEFILSETEGPGTGTVEPPSPRPTDTPGLTATSQSPTPTPFDTPTPLPVTPPATEPEVVIREILGAGVLAGEAVFIFNSGRAVRMEGWTLTDVQGNVYTFPNLFLGTGGSVHVHTGSGSNSATDLYWGLDAPVWGEPGDVTTLRDESGLLIDTLELP